MTLPSDIEDLSDSETLKRNVKGDARAVKNTASAILADINADQPVQIRALIKLFEDLASIRTRMAIYRDNSGLDTAFGRGMAADFKATNAAIDAVLTWLHARVNGVAETTFATQGESYVRVRSELRANQLTPLRNRLRTLVATIA